jgi:hypothetical protein
VSSDAAEKSKKLWKPHPDDEQDVWEACEAADRGEFLSPEASEAFVRWLLGEGDESWRAECE